MGGNLGVTIRKENGEELRMSRWTNSMPSFVTSLKFIDKDQGHFKEYMNAWYEMKKDWEENKETQDYKLNMTPVYAPFPTTLSPDEYGLVVIDYQTNTILHCQGYCDMGIINLLEISMMSKGALVYGNNEDTKQKLNEYKEIFESGKLSLRVYDTELERYVENPIPDTFEGLLKIAKDKEAGLAQLKLNLSPWKVIRYDESKEGFLEMKEAIKELGFILNDEDEKAWEEYLDRRYED